MTGPYVPFRHWPETTRAAIAAAYTAKAAAAAERILSQELRRSCTCARPAELADDGRCSRCWGWPS